MVGPENLLATGGAALLHQGFLSRSQADRYFESLLEQLDWRQEHAQFFGRRVPLPRLTAWYGQVPYRYSGVEHVPAAWPAVIDELQVAVAVVVPPPNAVLANLYRDGRDCVGWHADDDAELGPQPVIASLSLGATRRFVLRSRSDGARVTVELSHGSLLVMAGDCQRCWQHAVPKTPLRVGPRVNLTFRRVVH